MNIDQLDHILSGLPDPILIVAPDLRVMLTNLAATDLLGRELQGQLLPGVIRQPDVLENVSKVLAGQKRAKARYTGPAAVAATYRVVISTLDAKSCGLAGAILCFSDISHVREAEQMRSDFVANVSHELRSPLTALSGFIETLRGPAREDPKAQAQFLQIMEREASRMNRLIGDLLSLSRVEALERVRPKGQVDAKQLVQGTIAAIKPLAEAEECEIFLQSNPESQKVPGDSDQLTQVFHNLIENAVRYGGDAVRIHLYRIEKAVGVSGPALRVDVIDNGEGIAPLHLPRLTERFYRVDDHRSRAKGGTGLGLAIVKHIINRHRGRLIVNSRAGQGSTFSVVLPLL
jgi:two-component system, OmpR family, phosphate regulon sensor histidine kinase PhoR